MFDGGAHQQRANQKRNDHLLLFGQFEHPVDTFFSRLAGKCNEKFFDFKPGC